MSLDIIPQSLFVRVMVDNRESVIVTPTHPFTVWDEDDEARESQALSLSDHLMTKKGVSGISELSAYVVEGGKKVKVCCEPFHEFWAGETEPFIQVHNITVNS
jgi:hypothetical protein